MDAAASEKCSSTCPTQNDDVYLVPYRWWKEAEESISGLESDVEGGVIYTASPVKITSKIFNSEIEFNLRRDDHSLQDNKECVVRFSDREARDYAMIPAKMFLQARKWHNDSKASTKDGISISASSGDDMCDVLIENKKDDTCDIYPLQLRISIPYENSSLGVKISKMNNTADCFKRACKIFSVDSDELLRIWDFSGQTTQIVLNGKENFTSDSQCLTVPDIFLKLRVYGLSDFSGKESEEDEMIGEYPRAYQMMMPGSAGKFKSNFFWNSSQAVFGNSYKDGPLGLTGLGNLGNTCFMNSALQCLAHTPKLVNYFLGDYSQEINHENPLGMNGELAAAFGNLLKKLWTPGTTSVIPKSFKSKLAHFAPQFGGFNQHDSQELLAFLLDGLHEDLNRVKTKRYTEAKDSDGRPDEVLADEYWQNHLARNNSIIVDVCQGQYRSRLICRKCGKVSITFDPFMYLSVPVPPTSKRKMTLTVLTTDGSSLPSTCTITVLKNGKLEDLIRALSDACSLGVDETLLVVEIHNGRIWHYYESDEPLDKIKIYDHLVAYRLPKGFEKFPLVVFMHQRKKENKFWQNWKPSWESFGIPLVASCDVANRFDIRALFLKLLAPYLKHNKNNIDNCDNTVSTATEGITEMEEEDECSINPWNSEGPEATDLKPVDTRTTKDFWFYKTNESVSCRGSKIVINEPITYTVLPRQFNIIVNWPDKMVKRFNTHLLSTLSLPTVFNNYCDSEEETVSLYKCIEAYLKDEPLGPDDMWYCPDCKEHCRASKKLDLWRLPEVLVIHLKRFSYSRYLKNKLETNVDFPVHDLDLSPYISSKSGEPSGRYTLYAISNHSGSMTFGHYTAFVHHSDGQWYNFDDKYVSPVDEDKIKSSAAYVLFYKRVDDMTGCSSETLTI